MEENKYETGYEGCNQTAVIYESAWDMIKDFPSVEDRYQALECILEYALYNKTPDLDSVSFYTKIAFKSTYRNVQENLNKRYKGGAPKGNQNAAKKQKENNQNNYVEPEKQPQNNSNNYVVLEKQPQKPSCFEKSNDVDVDVEREEQAPQEQAELVPPPPPVPPKKKFIKPTLEDVKAYVKEKGYVFNPEAFCSYYESRGWTVGKSAMKDWRAACVTWNLREKSKTTPAQRQSDSLISTDGYTSGDYWQDQREKLRQEIDQEQSGGFSFNVNDPMELFNFCHQAAG